MVDKTTLVLLQSMHVECYKTSNELAQICKISEKTVRVRLGNIRNEMEKHGARLIAKQGIGYRLEIFDRESFENWMNQETGKNNHLPDNPTDRINFILALLLNRNDYLKYDALSEFLYIGAKTLSHEMRQVELRLNENHIKMERRPGYGIKAVGEEFNIRLCIMGNLVQFEKDIFLNDELRKQHEIEKDIAQILLQGINLFNIKFSERAFESIVIYLRVSVNRMEQGRYITNFGEIDHVLDNKEKELADYLVKWVSNHLNITMLQEEVFYLAIFIAGKRMIGVGIKEESNFVISEKIDKLVMEMLETIYDTYRIELRDNFNLRMLLNQHMMPFDIRMKYGIKLENPLLENIRSKYFLAYTMAKQACIPVIKHYQRDPSDDEIAYLAVLFAIALEQKEQHVEKKNILLVCASGKASSQMLLYQFKKEFGPYLKEIHICNLYELDTYDLSSIDYIFTTVRINKHIAVPIIEIHDFLEYHDILSVRGKLQTGSKNFILEFYRKEFFLPMVKGDTKEEVLKNMCHSILKFYPLPEGFYDSILTREKLGNTDYGNLVAIPHPFKVLTPDNIVCVGILEKPILWVKNQVQLVVIVSISNSMQSSTQKFYEITSKLLLSSEAVGNIIESRQFETLLQALLEMG